MNQAIAYEKLCELSEEDLISFRAHLHSGFVPMHVWERRMEIVQDLGEIVIRIAENRGYELPSNRDLMGIAGDSGITPDENLQKYLGVSWVELEKSYFEKFAPSN